MSAVIEKATASARQIPAQLASQLATNTNAETRFDAPTRLIYSTDASNYQVMPLGVVLPRTHEDIAATVALCAEHGVPVVPRGGGSGLAGQAIGAGIVIDSTKYMDALLDVDPASRTARVQSGMILGQLNKRLAAHGLQFGPDPASAERAAVGGVIGTNATGSHSIRYGMTADNVTALRCVLADGGEFVAEPAQTTGQLPASIAAIVSAARAAVHRDYPKVWRRSSGYNLDFIAEMLAYDPANPLAALTPANARRQGSNLANHLRQISQFNLAPLIAGSEGTLAVVSEATLNLFPLPKKTGLVITAFDSLLDAMRAIPALLSLNPSAIELIGGLFIKLARDLPECRDRLDWLDISRGIPDGLLVIEFTGDGDAEVAAGIAALEQIVAREHLACTLRPLRDVRAQADVWYVRKIGLNVLASIRSDFKPISVVEDVAVPVDMLPAYVARLRAIFAQHNTEGAFYAHASAGVLHVRPLINLKTLAGLRAMQDIGRQAFALCHELGGAMTGEHGDGYERSHWNRGLFGAEVYDAFVAVKRAFDPKGLLNPNKKVDAFDDEKLESMMRLGPAYQARPFNTTFTFQKDGSMARLAEQCNGSGVCRKPDSGVMCPSYRATRDEMHSTRGRANLLREFLKSPESRAPSPQNGAADSGLGTHDSGLTSADVKSALDLCLSCKACETECASGVDMAKMKSEFVQHIYDEQGVPLRAWVFARIAKLSALAAPVAPLANWALGLGITKKILSLAPDRTLPRFAARTFQAWWRERGTVSSGDRPLSSVHRSPSSVVLFADTFTRFNHPQIGIAAVRVLEHLGYTVTVPPWQCCGRPALSQGQPKAMLDAARFNIAALAPYARQGIPILGLEPSCISALKDDYLDLLPGDDAQAVAQATWAIEDWLHASAEFRARSAERARPKHSALLHGHCHQKALWGTGATKRVLGDAGFAVKEIESTCCGMAGAFGYEAEHAALSQKIGELGVLPAARAAPADTRLVAAGTSCRDQIAQLAGRKALHPIQVLAEALLP
jgi:FAD/FMN-containing dehydrogenase/Fe-S oxidoreductase